MSSSDDIRAETGGASTPLDRAAAAYEFGVMPGDESEATEEELREFARRVLDASGYPTAEARLREMVRRAHDALEETRTERDDARADVERLRTALQWIADHETDEAAIDARSVCDHPFHVTRPALDDDRRCPRCFSRWWATDGSLPSVESNYAFGAVAAKALAEALGSSETET